MKTFLFWLFLLGGAVLLYFVLNVYWSFVWIGLCLAYAILAKRLFRRDAMAITAFAITFIVLCLGGGTLLANQWSEAAAGIWVVLCILFVMLFAKKIIRRLSPALHMAEIFDEVVREKEMDKLEDMPRD